MTGKMGGAQDWREWGAAPQATTSVRGATGRASPEWARGGRGVYCRAGGACSAPGGEAICVGISHRLWCGESRMGFDPGDGLVMMPADYSEKGPDPPDEGLVAAGFDGVVAEEADAVLAVGEEIDALPDHSGERSGSATNPVKGVVNRADLSRIVRGRLLRYRYRITYFDICGARAIFPRFATVLLRSLLYFISILIQ